MAKTYRREKIERYIRRLERDKRMIGSRIQDIPELQRKLFISMHDAVVDMIIKDMREFFDIVDGEG